MKEKRDDSGFSLVELIVVIAILAILVAVLVPVLSSYIQKSKVATDDYVLSGLNEATRIYYTEEPSPNLFEDSESTDEELLLLLVDEDFYAEIPTPKQSDMAFKWDYNSKEWIISESIEESSYIVTASDVTFGTASFWFEQAIIDYVGTATDIIVPSTLDDVNVLRVYQDAFSGNDLTSVTFASDSEIVQIHARAFKDNDLTEVELPSSLMRLDQESFTGNNITKVTIGSDVTLEYNVFLGNDLFKDTYYAEGKAAGTYLYIDGEWVKQ